MKIGLLSASRAESPPHLMAAAGLRTRLKSYPVRIANFAYSPSEFLIQQVSFVEAGLRAPADGCDRIVYVSMADYGIEALRSLVDIPVSARARRPMQALPRRGPSSRS